jgi:hypothetical protein
MNVEIKKYSNANKVWCGVVWCGVVCSGLIEMDTLIKDNVVNYWSPHESKTSTQELPKRI